MDKQSSSPTKRFRSDMINVRAKQTMSNINYNKQRTTQLSYRNTNNMNNYQKQQEQSNQISSLSPAPENYDDNMKEMLSDIKQNNDIDLNMFCFEEQLSDVQLEHSPVKVCLFLLNNLNCQSILWEISSFSCSVIGNIELN